MLCVLRSPPCRSRHRARRRASPACRRCALAHQQYRLVHQQYRRTRRQQPPWHRPLPLPGLPRLEAARRSGMLRARRQQVPRRLRDFLPIDRSTPGFILAGWRTGWGVRRSPVRLPGRVLPSPGAHHGPWVAAKKTWVMSGGSIRGPSPAGSTSTRRQCSASTAMSGRRETKPQQCGA